MSIFDISIKPYKDHYIMIKNFPIQKFSHDVRRVFKSKRLSNIFEVIKTFMWFYDNLIIHEFFLPEVIFIMEQLPMRREYRELKSIILHETWMVSTLKNYPSLVNLSLINDDLNFKLKSYQEEFLKLYDDKKQKYNLNGYILAFEQGLGKTFTSLSLMHGMKKEAVIIVAPKSTLRSVWVNEINTVFKEKQSIWLVGEEPKDARFYIVNYESLDKISKIISQVLKHSGRVGIIVDESHNFRSKDAQRVIRLLSIAKITKCNDILLLSGTPIKALGSEMIPTLQIIDPLFDEDAKNIFGKVFGLSVPVALDVLKNRLGLMMFRKMKSEVLKLPDKNFFDIKIKIPNGNDYTLENVKKRVQSFVIEREMYYKKNFVKYQKDFDEAIRYVDPKIENDEEFIRYKKIVKRFQKNGFSSRDQQDSLDARWANDYEKKYIIPLLPSELKKRFIYSKSVIKYVELKIMGEVIGGLLNKLRSEMFGQMIPRSPLVDIINKSEKKTLCFTTFTDVVEVTSKYIISEGFKPIEVYGKTNANVKQLLDKFKTDNKYNPLIATIQSLSTGVTIIEANTVVFLNKPWRITDYEQAYSRVHRIGQDVNVNIYNFSLDTGDKDNLSTRMESIIEWSKQMFEGIVGDLETN